MQADRRSHREAANLLIDSLLERRSPGWYTEFVDALKAAGNTHDSKCIPKYWDNFLKLNILMF